MEATDATQEFRLPRGCSKSERCSSAWRLPTWHPHLVDTVERKGGLAYTR